MVEVVRLDVGNYMFGKYHIFVEFGDPDGDGEEELLACVAHKGETECPEFVLPNPEADDKHHDPTKEVGAEIPNRRWKNFLLWIHSKYEDQHLHWLNDQKSGGSGRPTAPPKIQSAGVGAKSRMSIMPGSNQFVR